MNDTTKRNIYLFYKVSQAVKRFSILEMFASWLEILS